MMRLLTIVLMICLTMPVLAEASEIIPTLPPLLCSTPVPEHSGSPECWVVAYGCLTDFLQAWAENNHEEMLTLCAPSWMAQQTDPELSLFLLARNRTARDWRIDEMSFDGEDRVFAVDVLLDDYSGRELQWYSFTFRVVIEDDVRYVDPDGMAAGVQTTNLAYLFPWVN